ncbi:MAG: quinone-dependent dihydroorotate dehydrogenase [Gluconacetobacter diazotrophicus]|nr:quinone-dependent dihydroorotate dehydrogenase [Gluconacetobacter diazotrophicus]
MGIMQALPLAVLRRLDPERAHELALAGLALGCGGRSDPADDRGLGVSALGMRFRNPIGMAAGFDKDARVPRALARLGFGFVEAGTVTPLPQGGNPRPRLFRLIEDAAVVNRMGFNNGGLYRFNGRVERMRTAGGPRKAGERVPFGANLGINKEGADPPRDLAHAAALLAPMADYLVVNLSSPNTPGLRALQAAAPLREILAAIAEAVPQRPPLLVKLAPDLPDAAIAELTGILAESGIVDGLVLTNTLLARPAGLRSPFANENGGLSGRPLRQRSREVLRIAAGAARGRQLALVSCGGIEDGADILGRIRDGAALVQLYTRFSVEGPALLRRLKRELRWAMRHEGIDSLDAVRNSGGTAR